MIARRERGSLQSLWPHDLLNDGTDVAENSWWAIYTKSRQEKALARSLYECGLRFFLPLVRTNKAYGHRKVEVQLPLFPNYMFLNGTGDDRIQALATNRVSRTLCVPDPEKLVRELKHLHRLINCGAALTPESRLVLGDRVRIRTGLLAGIEGTVVRRRNETRLLCSVDYLGCGASTVVDDFMLERID